jgi:hypothetical protein
MVAALVKITSASMQQFDGRVTKHHRFLLRLHLNQIELSHHSTAARKGPSRLTLSHQ